MNKLEEVSFIIGMYYESVTMRFRKNSCCRDQIMISLSWYFDVQIIINYI